MRRLIPFTAMVLLAVTLNLAAVSPQLLTTGVGGGVGSSTPSGAWANYQMVVNGSAAYSVDFPSEVTCSVSSGSNTYCTGEFIHTTVAGHLLYFGVITYNGSADYISSIYTCATLSSGKCTSGNAIDTATVSGTHAWAVTNGTNDSIDQAYVPSGTGGAVYFTVNLTAASTVATYIYAREASVPAGSAVLDAYFTTDSSNCTSCTGTIVGGSYTLTGTDVVLVTVDSVGGLSGFNSPWTLDRQGTLSLYNVTSLTTPTFSQANIGCGSACYFTFAGMAFKTSQSFTLSPPNLFTVNNPYPHNGYATAYNGFGDTTCSPTCTLTLPAQPAQGDALVILEQPYNAGGSTATLSSVSINGTSFTIPSGSNTCQKSDGSANAISCGLLLSVPASAGAAVVVTMTASGTFNFRVYDVGRSSGTFALDCQNSIYTSTAANPATGPSCTPTGANDIVFVSALFTTSSPPYFNFIGSLYYWMPSGVEYFYSNTGSAGTADGWSEVLPNTTNTGASSFLLCATSGSGPCPSTSGSAILASIVALK